MLRNGTVVQWAISLVRSLVSWVQFLDISLFFLSFIITIKCKVQSWTAKAHKLGIWVGTQWIDEFISDSCSDSRKTSKKPSLKFSHVYLGSAKFLGQKIGIFAEYMYQRVKFLLLLQQKSIKNGIQMHHRSSRNTAMTFLLPDSPLSRLAC